MFAGCAGVLRSMKLICWVGVLLISLGSLSSAALSARAPTAPAAHASPGAPPQGGAVPETRIAAVVNDEVISIGDLSSRVRMVMLSSNLAPSPDTEKRVAAQVLRTIVDEKLQMQEAKRLNIAATDDEVKKAVTSIEKQNNMQPGSARRGAESARHRAQRAGRPGDRLDRLGESWCGGWCRKPTRCRTRRSTTR